MADQIYKGIKMRDIQCAKCRARCPIISTYAMCLSGRLPHYSVDFAEGVSGKISVTGEKKRGKK